MKTATNGRRVRAMVNSAGAVWRWGGNDACRAGRPVFAFAFLLTVCFLPACEQETGTPDSPPPAGTGRAKTEATTPEPEPRDTQASSAWRLQGSAMVAAADPRAVAAAIDILEQGGHAVDAAIAAHAVLGLVEPQSSGIGGGAFMLVHERGSGSVTAYDSRETAPAAMRPDAFLRDGAAMDFITAWQSGASIGVPGVPALYAEVHRRHGRLAWATLFVPAIALAENGFEVSPRLADRLANRRLRAAIRLDDNPATAAYFYPDGQPVAAGDRLRNPEYAATLRMLASDGAKSFYEGAIAGEIVAAASAPPNGGTLSLADMAAYRVRSSEALCSPFRRYKVCSAPPPSSGGVALGMILGLYERFDPSGHASEENAILAFVDAQRLAYSDRDHYVADPEFVTVPVAELLDQRYLDVRAMEVFAPDAVPQPGEPGGTAMRDGRTTDRSETEGGTTHLSIVDGDGNAMAMTASVEAPFGSSRMAGGFLLNNQLTDFSFVPARDGRPVANAVAGGKRPRSSMSPTLVFDRRGDLVMATGSPGGNAIIAYVTKSLLGVLEWNMDAPAAAALPNIVARGRTVKIEIDGGVGAEIAELLEAEGYEVERSDAERSGLHIIVARRDGFEGAADPRGEGAFQAIAGQ